MIGRASLAQAGGFKPRRDIVLALTGDEETTQDTTAVLAQEN